MFSYHVCIQVNLICFFENEDHLIFTLLKPQQYRAR